MEKKRYTRALAIKSLTSEGSFWGYASVFGVVDSYNEIVASGAFRKSLAAWQAKEMAPAMLWMHDTTKPIGLWASLAEDTKGLIVCGHLAMKTQAGREAYELLKMGALTGLSIGYRVAASRTQGRGRPRILTEIDLFEISLVTFPANEAARIGDVKSPGPLSACATIDEDRTRAVVARLHEAARTLQHNQRGMI